MITGWSNGKVCDFPAIFYFFLFFYSCSSQLQLDARLERSGEVIFKDTFHSAIAGVVSVSFFLVCFLLVLLLLDILFFFFTFSFLFLLTFPTLQSDYRLEDKELLIACSNEGEGENIQFLFSLHFYFNFCCIMILIFTLCPSLFSPPPPPPPPFPTLTLLISSSSFFSLPFSLLFTNRIVLKEQCKFQFRKSDANPISLALQACFPGLFLLISSRIVEIRNVKRVKNSGPPHFASVAHSHSRLLPLISHLCCFSCIPRSLSKTAREANFLFFSPPVVCFPLTELENSLVFDCPEVFL